MTKRALTKRQASEIVFVDAIRITFIHLYTYCVYFNYFTIFLSLYK